MHAELHPIFYADDIRYPRWHVWLEEVSWWLCRISPAVGIDRKYSWQSCLLKTVWNGIVWKHCLCYDHIYDKCDNLVRHLLQQYGRMCFWKSYKSCFQLFRIMCSGSNVIFQIEFPDSSLLYFANTITCNTPINVLPNAIRNCYSCPFHNGMSSYEI